MNSLKVSNLKYNSRGKLHVIYESRVKTNVSKKIKILKLNLPKDDFSIRSTKEVC